MNDALFLLFVPGLPLSLVLAWCVPPWRKAVCHLAPWAPLPALWLAFTGTTGSSVTLEWILLGSQLGLGELHRVFLGFTAALWLGAGIYARGYLKTDSNQARFYLLWLATLAGNLGLIVAQDIASFYLFFALMTFAAYGLVIHEGGPETLRAGRVYLIMAVMGEGLIIAGLLMGASLIATPLLPMLDELPAAIAQRADNASLIIICLLLGFGIKAGLPLLHMWLPLAHPVAPVPASAVLSGAMIKAGLLAWINTLPLGLINLETLGTAVIVAGLVAAFGGAFIGVQQTKPKTVLAYSSISQMGLITVAVGAGLYNPLLWTALAPVVALYALHHGLAKGALFLGVGIAHHPGPRIKPWLWLALSLPGLALAGWMASGAVAKLGLKEVLYEARNVPDWWSVLPLLLAMAAIGTTALIARYLWLLQQQGHDGTSAPAQVWLGWLFVLAASVFSVLLLPVTAWGGRWPDGSGDLLDLVWPVLLGLVLSWLASRYAKALPIPAGDVLSLMERVGESLSRAGRRTRHKVVAPPQQGEYANDRLQRFLRQETGHSQQLEFFWRRDAALVFAALIVVVIVLLF